MDFESINLNKISTFKNVKSLKKDANTHIKSMNPIYIDTFKMLVRYSYKFRGVSYLKVKTIADELGISISTVKRHLKFLSDNGYITIINTFRRVKGGKGANVYVIHTVQMREAYLSLTDEEKSALRS